MSKRNDWLFKTFKTISLLLVLGGSMSACAATNWKEGVLLHDGRTLIVERSQTYGGRHEVGQPSPIKESSITFRLPNSSNSVTWISEYSEDIGRANFNLLALHILNNEPYIVAEPNLCLSYNKWGRPNPPYVIFKYTDKAWKRIGLSELPSEFITLNVGIMTPWDIRDGKNVFDKGSLISTESIKKFNAQAEEPEHKTILREALPDKRINEMCEERVFYKGSWILPNDPVARQFIDRQQSK